MSIGTWLVLRGVWSRGRDWLDELHVWRTHFEELTLVKMIFIWIEYWTELNYKFKCENQKL